MNLFSRLSSFAFRSLSLAALSIAAPVFSAAVSSQTPKPTSAFAETTLATVESRTITRGDAIREYSRLDPLLLGKFLLRTNPQFPALAPDSLEAYCRYVFADPERVSNLEKVVQGLMVDAAFEEAAANRKIVISDQEIKAKVHENLEIERQSVKVEAAKNDEELAEKLNRDLPTLIRLFRRLAIRDRLALLTLEERQGHPLEAKDYLGLSVIYVGAQIPLKQTQLDLKTAQTKAETAYANLRSQKWTFGEAAKAVSDDPSKVNGGKIGTVLKVSVSPELLKVAETMKSGEIKPPIRFKSGFIIVRLDKRNEEPTEEERTFARKFFLKQKDRVDKEVAYALKDIRWNSSFCKPPEWIRETSAKN